MWYVSVLCEVWYVSTCMQCIVLCVGTHGPSVGASLFQHNGTLASYIIFDFRLPKLVICYTQNVWSLGNNTPPITVNPFFSPLPLPPLC